MGRALDATALYREPVDTAGGLAFALCALALVMAVGLPALGPRLRLPVVDAAVAVLAAVTVATVVYAFGAEGYTNDGRTVWEVSNWPRRWLFLAVILLGAAVTGFAVLTRKRLQLVPFLAGAMIVVVALDYAALASSVE